MYNNGKVTLVSTQGARVVLDVEADIVLAILSIFGLGWIKFFIDRNVLHGVINLLLVYTGVGSLVHGLILALSRKAYFNSYLTNGYYASTQQDADIIAQELNLYFPVYNGPSNNGQGFQQPVNNGQGFQQPTNNGQGFQQPANNGQGFQQPVNNGQGFQQPTNNGQVFQQPEVTSNPATQEEKQPEVEGNSVTQEEKQPEVESNSVTQEEKQPTINENVQEENKSTSSEVQSNLETETKDDEDNPFKIS